MKIMQSKRLSFKGYSFSVALGRNVDAIKAVVALLTGANYMLGFDWKTLGISLIAGIATLAVKLLADAVDFYFSDI
jgi:hypothetical protein